MRDFAGTENVRVDSVILIITVRLWGNACSLCFQCQTAALDELFGNPEECFQRYQTAQILLHSLSQQVNHQQDRALLTKCKLCACVLISPCFNDDHIKNFVRDQNCNGSLEWAIVPWQGIYNRSVWSQLCIIWLFAVESFWGGGIDTWEDWYVNICIFIPVSCILQHSFLLFTMCTILKLRLDLSFVSTPLLMSFHFFFHLF